MSTVHTANEGPERIQYKCLVVWFPFMYSQKWNCAASLFPKQNYNVLSPNSYLIYLWEIYIFPGPICLFCCRKICEPIIGIHKSLTDTWMWKLGLRLRNSFSANTSMGFSLQFVLCRYLTSEIQNWRTQAIILSRPGEYRVYQMPEKRATCMCFVSQLYMFILAIYKYILARNRYD